MAKNWGIRSLPKLFEQILFIFKVIVCHNRLVVPKEFMKSCWRAGKKRPKNGQPSKRSNIRLTVTFRRPTKPNTRITRLTEIVKSWIKNKELIFVTFGFRIVGFCFYFNFSLQIHIYQFWMKTGDFAYWKKQNANRHCSRIHGDLFKLRKKIPEFFEIEN